MTKYHENLVLENNFVKVLMQCPPPSFKCIYTNINCDLVKSMKAQTPLPWLCYTVSLNAYFKNLENSN